MSANEKSPRKTRGIAASGEIFHVVNGDGIVGRDLMTRVSHGGKRIYLNLGADPVQANYLNGIARKSLRDGKDIAEVRTVIEEALRAHRALGAPPSSMVPSGPNPTRDGKGHSPAPSATAPSSPHGGDLPKPTKADVSIEGSLSTPIPPTPPKIARPSHSLSTNAIQAGSGSRTNTIIQARATATTGYGYTFQLQTNERNTPPPSIKIPLFRDLLAAQIEFHSKSFPRDSTIHGYWMSLLNAIETVSYARAGRLQDKPCRSGRKVSYEEFLFLSNGVTKPIMDCEISILDALLGDDWLLSVSDREYLLSDVRAERNRAADRVLQKLRALGYDTDKPLHCLRALFAAFLRATETDEHIITEQMGHSDIRTTVTYYAPLPLTKELVPLWRKTLKSLEPRPQQMAWDFAA